MKLFQFSISLLLICNAIQLQGKETVTLEGRIDANESQSHEAWIGVFELPVRRGAEAVSWTPISSEEFTLEVPDSEEVQIVALHRNFVSLVTRIRPRSTDAIIVLKFEEGLSMDGTVLSADNFPIENVGLTVKPKGLPNIQIPEHVKFYWLTDANGQFNMAGLLPNKKHEISVLLPNIPIQTFIVEFTERDKSDQDLRLSNAFFVTGRVADIDQDPVQDATISARFIAERGGAVAASDGNGDFRIGPFVRNKDLWLTARHEEFGSSNRLQTTSGEHDLELVLSGMVQVIGTVLDASTGEPLDDFTIRAIRPDGSRDYSFTKSKGEIAILVDPQTIGLIVDAAEHNAHLISEVTFESVNEHDLGVIALELGRQLTGRVFDDTSGQPVEGATATLRDYSWNGELKNLSLWISILRQYRQETVRATSDDKGEFVLKPLPLDSTQIGVEARDYLEQELQVDPTLTVLDIGLRKDESESTRIRGRIESPAGDPLSGTVSFSRENAILRVDVQIDGLFDSALEPDTYEVIAITEHGNSDAINVVLGQNEIKDVQLVVDSKGRVTGIIEGLANDETVALELRSGSKGSTLRTVTEITNGNFVMEGVGFGTFTLAASSNKSRKQERSFEVDAESGEAYVELNFGGNSRLYGTVRYLDGSVPNGEVKAVAKESGKTSSSSVINSEGTYEIAGLEDGEYSVHFSQTREIRMEREGGRFTTSTTLRLDLGEVMVNGEAELNIELPSPSDAIIEIGD